MFGCVMMNTGESKTGQLCAELFCLPLQTYSVPFSICSPSQEPDFYGCMPQVPSPMGCPSRRSERRRRVRSGSVV